MNEVDIKKILPDWNISGVLLEKEGNTLYSAEKTGGKETKYASISVIKVPSSAQQEEEMRKNCSSDFEYKEKLVSVVNGYKQEYRILRSLSSKPGIINLRESYDVFSPDGTECFLIARYSYFEPLTVYVKSNGFTVGAALKMGIDICRGLESLSQAGYCHGDINPECIFVDDKGRFRLGGLNPEYLENRRFKKKNDFTAMRYAAKEVCKEKTRNSRCDTYSLGLVLYSLLNNGKPPFEDEHEIEEAVKMRLSGEEIPSPAYNAGRLNDIILKSCSPVRDERYKGPKSMKADLQEAYKELEQSIAAKKKAEEKAASMKAEEVRTDEKEDGSNKSKKKKGGALKKALLSLVLVCCLAVGAYFGFSYKTGFTLSRDISDHNYSFASDADFSFDGTQKKPAVEIRFLTEGEDFITEYSDNIQIGTAAVKIKGIGKYHGEREISFNVVPSKCMNFYAPLVTTDTVLLRWDPVDGAESYIIYRYKSKDEWRKIDTVTSQTEYTVNGLTPSKQYKFRVRAATEVNGEKYQGVSTSLTVTTGS